MDRAFPRIDHDYVSGVSFEDELHVGRGDSNAEYNKDKFAEGEGGGDYIKGTGEGSQSTRRGEVGRQEDKGVLDGLKPYTEHEKDNLRNNERFSIAESNKDVVDFVKDAIVGKRQGERMLLGRLSDELAQKILDETGINLKNYNLELRADEIRHTLKEHGDDAVEALRGQQAITAEDIAMFPSIVNNYDAVLLAHDNSLHFIKNIGGKITAVTLYARKSKSVSLKTMYKGVNSGDAFQAANTPEGQGHNVQNDLGATVSTHININDSAEESNKKNKNLSETSRDPFAKFKKKFTFLLTFAPTYSIL